MPGRLGWRTFPTPRCHALIGAALTGNPREAATRLCLAIGAGSCVGRPALETGASLRAACALDGGPRWGVLVEAPGAALGDRVISATRDRHRYGACAASPARPHP